jgi:hypothetical protein
MVDSSLAAWRCRGHSSLPLFSHRLRQGDDTPGRDIAGGHRGCQGQQFLDHDLKFNSDLDGSRLQVHRDWQVAAVPDCHCQYHWRQLASVATAKETRTVTVAAAPAARPVFLHRQGKCSKLKTRASPAPSGPGCTPRSVPRSSSARIFATTRPERSSASMASLPTC